MKAKESICKKRDKLEAKAAEDREQIQKLDDEVKSKNMFLKDLEACLNDVTERNDEISRSLERQHTVLREKLKRWKTQLQGRIFNYKNDFDGNGIIYWFGFNPASKEFTNPARNENCGITVTRSSNDKGDATDILDLKNPTVPCCTKNKPHSWWQVDFGEKHAIFATHYTLRHGCHDNDSFLMNWNLEGSHDGENWEILSKHKDDRGIKYSCPFTGTWTVCQKLQAMRYFRIHQTGKNSAGKDALYLAGFEMYGVLLDMPSEDDCDDEVNPS